MGELDDLVEAVHEFWRRICAVRLPAQYRCTFLVQARSRLHSGWTKPKPPCISSAIHRHPGWTSEKITVCDKSTLRLSPNVSRLCPAFLSSNCHSASRAFSSHRRQKLSFSVVGVALLQLFLRDQRKGFLCPKYPGGDPISLAIRERPETPRNQS